MLLDTNFLILDEPTNHLDLKTKDIFQNALINYHGTIAIVSHDRYFLDHLVNKVFELKDGSINDYHGNYTYFIEKRSQASAQLKNEQTTHQPNQEQAFKNKEKKRLEAQERNKLSKIKSFWKKELAATEEKIQSLEARKAEHEYVLCDPQTHKDSSKIKKLNIELKDITSELEHCYIIWTELSYKLEQLAAGNINTIIGEH
jgi:ATP-binding cassette subfamily F protein 3